MSERDDQDSHLQHLMPLPPDDDQSAESPKSVKPIDRWLAFFGIALGVILYLLAKTSLMVVIGCLVIFASLAHPVWYFWWIEDKRYRQVGATVALATFVALVGYAAWPSSSGTSQQSINSQQQTASCQVAVETSEDIVVRLFTRRNVHELTSQGVHREFSFDFQQLFYDWQLSLVLKHSSSNQEAFVEIQNLTKDDSVRLKPEMGIVSDPLPKWFSGFPELVRHTPDFYARTMRIPLKLDQPTQISIRRQLFQPEISKERVIVITDIEAGQCQVHIPHDDIAAKSKSMTARAQSLANTLWNKQKHAIPIRRDPGDIKRDEFQATIEVRCKDDPCLERTVTQLEVHMGKSRYQPHR